MGQKEAMKETNSIQSLPNPEVLMGESALQKVQ